MIFIIGKDFLIDFGYWVEFGRIINFKGDLVCFVGIIVIEIIGFFVEVVVGWIDIDSSVNVDCVVVVGC